MVDRYFLIDGSCAIDTFRKFVTDLNGLAESEASLVFPSPEFLRQHVAATKTFAFDALDDDAYDARAKLWEQFALQYQCHFEEGFLRRNNDAVKKKKRREQKEVDVLLAVRALSFGYRRVVSEIAIWTEDQDFVPLLEELVSLGINTILVGTRKTPQRLRRSADHFQELTAQSLWSGACQAGYVDAPLYLQGSHHGPTRVGTYSDEYDLYSYNNGVEELSGIVRLNKQLPASIPFVRTSAFNQLERVMHWFD